MLSWERPISIIKSISCSNNPTPCLRASDQVKMPQPQAFKISFLSLSTSSPRRRSYTSTNRCLSCLYAHISFMGVYPCRCPHKYTHTCKHRGGTAGWARLTNHLCCKPSAALLRRDLYIFVSPSRRFQKCHWWASSSLACRTFIMVKKQLSAWHSGPQLSSCAWCVEQRWHSACKQHGIDGEIFVISYNYFFFNNQKRITV